MTPRRFSASGWLGFWVRMWRYSLSASARRPALWCWMAKINVDSMGDSIRSSRLYGHHNRVLRLRRLTLAPHELAMNSTIWISCSCTAVFQGLMTDRAAGFSRSLCTVTLHREDVPVRKSILLPGLMALFIALPTAFAQDVSPRQVQLQQQMQQLQEIEMDSR